MSWRVILTFPAMVRDEDNDLLHRVRNFGETLFKHFREHSHASVSLEEVDRATDTLVVEGIRTRDLKRTVVLLERMAQGEFPERSPQISIEKTPQ